MSTIKLKLSPQGIDEAIQQLEEYEKKIAEKTQLLLQRVAELGGSVASLQYETFTDYIGENDISVETVEQDGKFVILAKGQAVCFIEFGTGVSAGMGYDKTVDMDITPGSWSKTHGGYFVKDGYWYYNGEIITGSTPAKAMYNASKEIRQQLVNIAKEVLEND